MKRVDFLDKVKAQYDGYCFNLKAETVYNPVSAGQFFLNGGVDFADYWAETGNTKLLMDIAKKVDFNMATDLSERMDASSLRTFDILELASDHADASDLKALLFQSGYLTLKCSDDSNISYFLDFPNGETRRAFSLSILRTYAPRIASPEGNSALLLKYFENGQTESAVSVLKSLYASISYQLKETDHEKIHQIVFVSIMKALGAELNAELAANKGRIDAVLKTPAQLYVIEFKRDKSARIAMNQIKDSGYADQFEHDKQGKTIHLLGISFSSKERNINQWQEEIL